MCVIHNLRRMPAGHWPAESGSFVASKTHRVAGVFAPPLRRRGRPVPRPAIHSDYTLFVRNEPEVANLGIVRPPWIYLAAIVLGLLLNAAWPIRVASRAVSVRAGISAVLVAVALFLYAVRTFRAAGTAVPGNRPTTTIVRSGPYRWSRNPIYLAFSLFQLGLAFWVNSLWLLVTLVPAVALIAFVVIPREEQYLEKKFPSDYASYKASVRRWV